MCIVVDRRLSRTPAELYVQVNLSLPTLGAVLGHSQRDLPPGYCRANSELLLQRQIWRWLLLRCRNLRGGLYSLAAARTNMADFAAYCISGSFLLHRLLSYIYLALWR